jgi:hypothetical protein
MIELDKVVGTGLDSNLNIWKCKELFVYLSILKIGLNDKI